MWFAVLYAFLVGFGMVAQWMVSYVRKQIPELETEPYRIWFHIIAEMVTALFLLIAGVALLQEADWAVPLYLVAIGMLFYTSIVSPGYFAQKGSGAGCLCSLLLSSWEYSASPFYSDILLLGAARVKSRPILCYTKFHIYRIVIKTKDGFG